jgi:hypothetical protein
MNNMLSVMNYYLKDGVTKKKKNVNIIEDQLIVNYLPCFYSQSIGSFCKYGSIDHHIRNIIK